MFYNFQTTYQTFVSKNWTLINILLWIVTCTNWDKKCSKISEGIGLCACVFQIEACPFAYRTTRWALLRATSHTILRARAHYTSRTLIGGKGGARPSSLHTTLEGSTEYVNARWMWSLHRFLHGMKAIMFHGHLDYFQKPPLEGRPNTKRGDHGIPNAHNRSLSYFIMCEDLHV